MFFEYERGQGGGPVNRVTLNKEGRFAIIEFQDAKAVAAVLSKRPIKMLGATVDVDVYSAYLDDDEKFKSIELTDIPEELIKEIAGLNLKELTEPDSSTASGSSITQQYDSLVEYDWYHGDLDREGAVNKLRANGQDETFLIRNSHRPSQPYTISLFYKGLPHHLRIRKRPDATFELGDGGPRVFSDVPALVRFYQLNEFALIDLKVNKSYNICLGDAVKNDLERF